MPDDAVLYEKRDGIAIMTLNRPHRMNSLPIDVWTTGLPEIWADFESDPKVRVCIFTGSGDRAFCTGVDVKDTAERGRGPAADGERPGIKATARHNNVTKPVITAVNGLCGGGGLMFVGDSDITIASPNAAFFNPGVSVGIVALVGQVTWAKWVPFQSNMRMALMGAGERVPAQRALEMGIVTEVVEDKPLLDRALELAETMRNNSPAAMRTAKRILWAALEKGLTEGHEEMMKISETYRNHPDGVEGPRAFAEKRKPNWQDP